MSNETIFATYTTQTEADTFVRIFNLVNGKGRTARTLQVAPGQYQAIIRECPELVEFFFGHRAAA